MIKPSIVATVVHDNAPPAAPSRPSTPHPHCPNLPICVPGAASHSWYRLIWKTSSWSPLEHPSTMWCGWNAIEVIGDCFVPMKPAAEVT